MSALWLVPAVAAWLLVLGALGAERVFGTMGPWAAALWPLWVPFWLAANSGRAVLWCCRLAWVGARALRALGPELPVILDLIRGRRLPRGDAP